MKLGPINLLKDKAVIPKLEGVITEIFKPNNPTPSQANAGIHSQDFIIRGEDGVELKCQIMDKGMHLPRSTKGQFIELACTQGDRGESGLSVNLYAPPGKDVRFTVCVSRYATMKLKELSQAPAAAKAEATYKASLPTADDHCELMEGLISRFAEFFVGTTGNLAGQLGMNGKEVDPTTGADIIIRSADLSLRAATTVYIELAKSGMIKGKAAPAAEPASTVYDKPSDVPVAGEKPEDKNAVLDKVLARTTLGTLAAVLPQVERSMAACGLKWEEVYDALKARLVGEYDEAAIDQAHDDHRAAAARDGNIGVDGEKFYRLLCTDYATFLETVQSCNGPTPSTEPDNDEIPF